jgi:polyphosphate kinase 2 (PPK2 family)
VIRKIFLNVSKTEQRRRFLERLQDPCPADHKWFTRLAVAAIVIETLEDLNFARAAAVAS